ncbi:MAG: hypothetical protein KatS3mg124_0603 [Porticoccaceae bacterium]|nr:MAG: hypothetical protein KatS3mg124_0603 [Porticoccaceae bacterium]
MDELIAADFAIRQLYARFVDAAWRQDGAAYAELFVPEGEWKLAARHFRGRDEIAGAFEHLLGFARKVHVVVGQPLLQVAGDEALARTPCTEFTKMPDGSGVLAFGIYHDRFVRRDGQWRFRWRHFSLHYRGPADLSADLVGSPDYGPFPAMPEWDEPTLTVLHRRD